MLVHFDQNFFISFLTNITQELEIVNILSLRDKRDNNAVKALLKLYRMLNKSSLTFYFNHDLRISSYNMLNSILFSNSNVG